jgi:hypothetical protein
LSDPQRPQLLGIPEQGAGSPTESAPFEPVAVKTESIFSN